MDYYNDIYKMPRSVYHTFQKDVMMLAGIGNGIEDIDKRLSNIYKFVDEGKKDYAFQELDNLRVLMWNVDQGQNALLESVKNLCKDESSKKQAEGLSLEELTETLNEVKKKFSLN